MVIFPYFCICLAASRIVLMNLKCCANYSRKSSQSIMGNPGNVRPTPKEFCADSAAHFLKISFWISRMPNEKENQISVRFHMKLMNCRCFRAKTRWRARAGCFTRSVAPRTPAKIWGQTWQNWIKPRVYCIIACLLACPSPFWVEVMNSSTLKGSGLGLHFFCISIMVQETNNRKALCLHFLLAYIL